MNFNFEMYGRLVFYGLSFAAWLLLMYKDFTKLHLIVRIFFFFVGFAFVLNLALRDSDRWIYFLLLGIFFVLLCAFDSLIMQLSHTAGKAFLRDLGFNMKYYPLWLSLLIHGAFVCLALSWA